MRKVLTVLAVAGILAASLFVNPAVAQHPESVSIMAPELPAVSAAPGALAEITVDVLLAAGLSHALYLVDVNAAQPMAVAAKKGKDKAKSKAAPAAKKAGISMPFGSRYTLYRT